MTESFLKDHFGWYIIFINFQYNFGVFLGSIISALADINEFSPSITLLFMGLPTMGFAATFAIYFFTIKNIETPARYLELGELHKVRNF